MGSGSTGNREGVSAGCGAVLCAAHSSGASLIDVRWDRVLRVRALLSQGAYSVSSACVADAILRRIPMTA